ncbi:MAG: hypothetical protein V4616_02260 [Bacteroidota bacterium]
MNKSITVSDYSFVRNCKYAAVCLLVSTVLGFIYGLPGLRPFQPALFTVGFTAAMVFVNFALASVFIIFVLILSVFKKLNPRYFRYWKISAAFFVVYMLVYAVLSGLKLFIF